MEIGAFIEEALEARGNTVMVIARPADGDQAEIVAANSCMARLVGSTPERLRGSRLVRLQTLACDDDEWETLIDALRASAAVQLDLRLRVGGRETWLGLGLSFKRDDAGACYAVAIGRDVTDIRRKRQEDEGSQRLLASVFLRTSAPVTIVRPNGAILMANPAFARLLGYDLGELTGCCVQTLTVSSYGEIAQAARIKQLRDGAAYEIHIETIGKSGAPIPVRLTSVLMRGIEDSSLRVVTLLPDRPATTVRTAPAVAASRCVGQVQAISLAAFKTHFGERWPGLASRAMMLAEQVVKRRLAADDVFNRSEDEGFVIWFGQADPVRNAAVLARATREIRLRFLDEFGAGIAASVGTVMVEASPQAAIPGTPLTPALSAHLQQGREVAAAAHHALVADLRADTAGHWQPVMDRDRRAKPIALADFTPALRGRAAMLQAGDTAEIDLLRLDMAIRGLAREGGGAVLPLAWGTLTEAEPRRRFDARLGQVDSGLRLRLMLAVADVPAFTSPHRWNNLAASLRGRVGDVGLAVTLAEGDAAEPLEALVAEWPLPLLILDATQPGSLPPDGYFGVTAAARKRRIEVLVRQADPADFRDWRELGATIFA